MYCWSLVRGILSITLLACAAAAKSLQSCLTLCNPIDGSPPGMWNECNCAGQFGIALLWNWNEKWPFLVLWPLLSFPNCWHIEYSTSIASSFRIWNSSTGIPSPLPALFIEMLSKATWLHTPGCLALDEWLQHRGYPSH